MKDRESWVTDPESYFPTNKTIDALGKKEDRKFLGISLRAPSKVELLLTAVFCVYSIIP